MNTADRRNATSQTTAAERDERRTPEDAPAVAEAPTRVDSAAAPAPREATPSNAAAPPMALKSDLLDRAGFRHAFFTRAGGFSAPPYDSLNFSVAVGDSPPIVERNVELAAAYLGTSSSEVLFLNQVHGREVVAVDEALTRAQALLLSGDAIATKLSGLACGVRTADCVPVLFGCPDTGWVAAAHAGWRGCVQGIVLQTVRFLRARHAGRILAAIGPHISGAAFEVASEVAAELARASPDPDIVDRSRERPHVDLRKMVRAQLLAEGLASEDIDDVLGCTLLEPSRFFSFRRDGKASGRHLSAITAPG